MNKNARQRALANLIAEQLLETQQDLADALKQQGFEVTQATLSRDLKELNVAKVRKSGRSVYAIGGTPSEGRREAESVRMIVSFVTDIKRSDNLIVVKTDPGNAQAVAAAIDRLSVDDVLGTVAGDDTIVVITRPGSAAQQAEDRLRSVWEERRMNG